MTDTSRIEVIPISSLNALEYCPRSFYYQVVQGEMLVNEFVLEGQLAHQRVHQAGTHTTAEGEIETTSLYLYSEALHLSGFADVIEERAGVQAWTPGQLAQRTYPALRAGAVPGRAAAGQSAHCLWLHLLHWVAATGQGGIHAAAARQDESGHCPGVQGGSS